MVKEERLSAVAKRRRLNTTVLNGATTPTHSQQTTTTTPSVRAKTDSPLESEDDSNSFDALVDRNLVAFSSRRTVVAVNDAAIKVQLYKGQDCLVCGQFFLWVRQGVITLAGAKLDFSAQPQRVYHPENEDIPAIHCLSRDTEFQLESDETPLWGTYTRLPSRFTWIVPDTSMTLSLTFVLDGVEAASQTSTVANGLFDFKKADLHPLRKMIEASDPYQPVSREPDYTIICGRRSSAISKLSAGYINYILTGQTASGQQQQLRKILLLDLDLHNPGFTPPGIASLVHVKRPIFMPPHARYALSDNDFEILSMQFFDKPDVATNCHLGFGRLIRRLQEEISKFPEIQVVVNGWDVFAYLPLDHVERFGTSIVPSRVFCLGTDTSENARFGELLAERTQAPFHRITCGAIGGPTPAEIRRATTRSYFGFDEGEIDSEGCVVATAPQSRSIQLSFGPPHGSDQIRDIYIQKDLTGSMNIIDWLLGRRVAILLEPSTDLLPTEKSAKGTKSGFVSAFADHNVHSNDRLDASRSARRPNQRLIPIVHGPDAVDQVILQDHECIGLGIISHIDIDNTFMRLQTPVPTQRFEHHLNAGYQFLLVASKH